MGESFYDAKTGPKWDDFGKHYAELATRDAAEQVRRNALPQKPDDVKVELPKDFKLPQGMEFKLDANKPEFGKFRELAVKHGLSQEAVADFTGVYAETLVGSQSTIAAAKAAEVQKLGANGTNRVSSIETWMKSQGLNHLSKMLVTADIVSDFETLISRSISQGGARFSQANREPPEPQGRVTEEQWGKMTPAERLDYNSRFDQAKMPAWQDPRARVA